MADFTHGQQKIPRKREAQGRPSLGFFRWRFIRHVELLAPKNRLFRQIQKNPQVPPNFTR
jgi:hypothetical protein